jgi:hypothetical protein
MAPSSSSSDDEQRRTLPLTGHLSNTSIQLVPSPPTTGGVDISRYIKFKLDAAKGNYHKWRNFFLTILTKYNARDHVEEETDPHLADAEWRSSDVEIILWIYGSISDELQDVILQADGTAYTAWKALAHFFTSNAESRETLLDKQLKNTVQGDMDIITYSNKLKSIADQLADVGAPVTEKKLTMQLIEGLDVDRFKNQQDYLELATSFPSFMDVRARLQLAEQKLQSKAKSTLQILHADAAPNFVFRGNCYTCGAPGHMARDCPRGGDRGPNGRGGGYGQQPGYGGGGYNYGGRRTPTVVATMAVATVGAVAVAAVVIKVDAAGTATSRATAAVTDNSRATEGTGTSKATAAATASHRSRTALRTVVLLQHHNNLVHTGCRPMTVVS